jgi:hypothetical protein
VTSALFREADMILSCCLVRAVCECAVKLASEMTRN